MIPITPFAWSQSARKAPASIASTRPWSSAGKASSVARPGTALITRITWPGLRRRRRRPRCKPNRSSRRGPKKTWVAMIPITPFAWRQSARKAPASIASTRQWSSAGKGPWAVRPGTALITPATSRHPRSRSWRRQPNRPSNERNRRSQRSQRNRCNHRRHRNQRNRSSAECVAVLFSFYECTPWSAARSFAGQT